MPGLYVHIPFCEKKCIYCDFYSIESFRRYDDFISALHREIDMRAAVLPDDIVFHSIFFGGGTPSLLTDVQMGGVLEALRARFRVEADAEVTVECNPGTVDASQLRGYRSAGVNRLSFGVQSFHADDLLFLSRIHTAEEAEHAIGIAQDAGITNINLDLMFSLPGQTPERWMYNLERARDLGTTHLSCYSLTVEQGTPLARMVVRGMVAMPPEESDAELFTLTMETLEGWGFRQYEVSNYAREGYACRHNLTYWRHEDYLGFGPSAHSTWQGRRWWNLSSLDHWLGAVDEGRLPEAGGELLDRDTLRREYIYLRLRSEGIDLVDFRRRFDADLVRDNRAFIDRCFAGGTLRLEDDRLLLTREGILLCDEICAELE
ncbi:MAG: radical SAM family heme chaperone HemW [Bacteroidetes bacterium]|nr:radical SAM family heme chaperone HemW [Bacteroidota bacterium]